MVHDVLPAAALSSGASAVWLGMCRWFYRVEERAWRAALLKPAGYEEATIHARLETLTRHLAIAGRGSPADRLFIGGMVVASVMGAVALVIFGLR